MKEHLQTPLLHHASALGRLFGLGDHARVNIAGLIVLLALAGEITLFVSRNQLAEEFATITTPVITLALGYIFGKGALPPSA